MKNNFNLFKFLYYVINSLIDPHTTGIKCGPSIDTY